MIALIDYGSGNIRSVFNALRHQGADVQLVSSAGSLSDANAVVLPGVGAFGDCVRGLQQRGLWDPMREWMNSGKPFLGICVGYQLLFDESEESPGVRGFGFFPGKVKKFSSAGLKVPQIGWNSLQLIEPRHPLWQGLPKEPHVYFVHSYFPEPADASIVTSYSTYGETFAASVARENVAAVQFHPEKSQDVGLGILRNFVSRSQVPSPKSQAPSRSKSDSNADTA
ncbi:MAG TPA: imidazole glycerol phosphate synthase subunit HisH [Chthoniobacteraceae bacterium]|jgi:glutamine amidotransferase